MRKLSLSEDCRDEVGGAETPAEDCRDEVNQPGLSEPLRSSQLRAHKGLRVQSTPRLSWGFSLFICMNVVAPCLEVELMLSASDCT